MELYRDGIAVSPNRPSAVKHGGTAKLTIGGASVTALASTNGAIDEVALYNLAITAAQVKSHYNAAMGL